MEKTLVTIDPAVLAVIVCGVIGLVLLIGWVLNIVRLARSETVNGMVILRVIGIFFVIDSPRDIDHVVR
jgi:hypothetical protein